MCAWDDGRRQSSGPRCPPAINRPESRVMSSRKLISRRMGTSGCVRRRHGVCGRWRDRCAGAKVHVPEAGARFNAGGDAGKHTESEDGTQLDLIRNSIVVDEAMLASESLLHTPQRRRQGRQQIVPFIVTEALDINGVHCVFLPPRLEDLPIGCSSERRRGSVIGRRHCGHVTVE